MKWLLITTLGTNPGDEFARIGVQNLIRVVDPSPEFDLLNKENPNHYFPREFDRAVLCGMPLWWSTHEQDNYDIWWWDKIFESWISADRRKFMVLGAGHVYVNKIHNFAKYSASIDYVTRKAWAVTVREPVMCHPGIVDSVCPSAFAVKSRSLTRRLPLCNLMVDSGHFPHDSFEKVAWLAKEPDIVEALHKYRYRFVAHNDAEQKLAHWLGWNDSTIFQFTTPEEYLELYSCASSYFGHRLHGAAVCAAMKIPTWGVAYDSRVKMVQRLGGHACRPSEIGSITDLKQWLNGETGWIENFPANLELEWNRLKRLVERFAYE